MWGRVLWGKILETKIGGIVMSWLAVDKGGCEHIFAEKPCRNESNTLWIYSPLSMVLHLA